MSLDSGYPGSPSSGLSSYQSQTLPGIESARRELADLIKDQADGLPSFPDIFSSVYRDHAINTVTALDDADELDKEITDIVSQANSGIILSSYNAISYQHQ